MWKWCEGVVNGGTKRIKSRKDELQVPVLLNRVPFKGATR